MIRPALLFLFTILCHCLATAHTQPAEQWDGYRPTNQVDLPFAKIAQSSVVRLSSFSLSPQQVSGQEKIKVIDVSKVPRITDPEILNDYTDVLQVETCRRQNLQKCPVLTWTYDGSGFIDKGQQIYTCRHVVHNWATLAAQLNNVSISAILPALRIFSADGDMLYNSASSADPISFAAIDTDSRLNHPIIDGVDDPARALFALSEFVQMSSPVDLIPVKTLSFAIPAKGEAVYLSGFPGVSQASGTQLVSSSGHAFDFAMSQELFVSTALASGGISGGMATSADGRVYGMVCSFGPDSANPKQTDSISLFINPDGARILWKELLDIKL